MFTRVLSITTATVLFGILSGCATLIPGPKLAGSLVAGRDVQTDAWIFGLGADCTRIYGAIGLEGLVEFGTGKETIRTEGLFKVAQEDLDIEYNVLRASGRLRYRLAISDDGKIVGYPMLAPGYYRWKQKDCDFEGCTEDLFVMDIGAGVSYRFIGLELFTSANGPDFGARLRASIPIMR